MKVLDILKALRCETKMLIMLMLHNNTKMTVTQLSNKLERNLKSVSKNLKELVGLGMLTKDKLGRKIYYQPSLTLKTKDFDLIKLILNSYLNDPTKCECVKECNNVK